MVNGYHTCLSSRNNEFEPRTRDHLAKARVSQKEREMFSLVNDLPQYEYPLNLACRGCYKPLNSRKAGGLCTECVHSKDLFPVNYRRVFKKKVDDEEEEYSY